MSAAILSTVGEDPKALKECTDHHNDLRSTAHH